MSKFLRMTVLTIVLFAQLLAGVSVGAQVEDDFSGQLTALTLLETAENVEIENTDYGPMITSINDLKAEGTYYWAFNVNGEEASVGAHQYIPQVNDTISFKYDSWAGEVLETTTEETIKIVGLQDNSTGLSILQEVEDVEVEETAWGLMIQKINGLGGQDPYFWSFHVNGVQAQVGAEGYQPKHGDVLTFTYESWDPDYKAPHAKYVVAGISSSLVPPVDDEIPKDPGEEIPDGTPLEKVISWFQKNSTEIGEEAAIAFRHQGNAIPLSYIKSMEDKVIQTSGEFSRVTDLEKTVLGLIATEKDPLNINGHNLIEKIYNHARMTSQGLNGVFYALYALDSKDYPVPENATWTRGKLVDYIISKQLSNGGWALNGSKADVDITAMTITSLANYQDQPKVNAALNKAIEWLSDSQLRSGGFLNKDGKENSQSTAQVLIALSSIGISPEGEMFTKEEGNVLTNLTSFQNTNGGFSNLKDESSEPIPSTQALLALAAFEKFQEGKGSIYDLTVLPPLAVDETGGSNPGGGFPTPPVEGKKQNITISVRTHNSTILSPTSIEITEADTAISALVDVLGSRVTTSGSGSSAYVIAIDGLAEFDHGPTSGWKFSVNGYFPGSGGGTYRLNNGDNLEWVYVTEDKEAGDFKNPGVQNPGTPPDSKTRETLTKMKKMNEVLNKEQKMSAQEAERIKEALSKNTVKLEKIVNPDEDTVIDDATVDEAKIYIPKEALSEQTTIKIEELTTNENSGGIKIKSSIYQFLPKGTEFKTPVYISIQIPIEDDDLDNLVMGWFNEDTNEWEDIPTVIDAKTGVVTGLVKHFTKFAIIDKTKDGNDLDVKEEMNNLVTFLQNDETQSEWEDFGLALLNQSDEQKVLAGISENLKEVDGFFRKITDYERYVLTIKALDGNPTTIGGYNLIEKIYNNERMTMQGTNGLIFALIALDSGSYQVPSTAMWTREKILAEILDSQNTDGGFSLVKGEASDVDITAMAISSLVPYKEQPHVKTAIDKAVSWLSKVQQESGGFIADGHENSESAAQVIIGLTAAGVDPQSSVFTKAKGNVVTNLLSYQNADGGFANLKNDESNQIASEQALMAMIALDRFHNEMGSIYQLEAPEKMREVEVVATIPDFADADQISSYAKQSVYDAYDREIMRGVEVSPLRFAPKQNLTRAQFTAVLVTLLDGGTYADTKLIFEDVEPGQWYYEPVMRAKEMGIVAGTSDTTFSPNAPITREQVALLLARAFELKPNQEGASQSVYRDISTLNHGSKEAIQALYEHNLMKGYENGLFMPHDYVTREMGAALAIRIDDNF